MKNRNIHILLGGIAIALLIFFLHQIFYEYHFYYLEQFQLFLFDSNFISRLVFSIGGLSDMVSKFLQQFFLQPYMGPAIVAVLLTTIGVLVSQIIKKISDTDFFIGLPLLTIVSVAFLHFDHNYSLTGTIALIIFLFVFLVYLNLVDKVARLLFCVCAVVLLYLIAGAVGLLFAAAIVVYEVLSKPKESYLTAIPLVVAIIMPIVSMHMGWIGEWNRAWTPAMYYSMQLTAPSFVYFPWLIILVSVFIAGVCAKINLTKDLRKRVIGIALQSAIVIASIVVMLPLYGELRSNHYKNSTTMLELNSGIRL